MQLLDRKVGLDQSLFLIAGPCVVESEELQLRTAERLKAITDRLGVFFIFKSSFDKANRSSDKSYRGPGMDEGLRVLEKVRDALGVPVLTDVHDIPQIAPVAEVVDVLQTPAFLARQTDFIHAVAASGKPVNIKKA
ncbi:MAG TPA: 3-deoxy-8-phosphooctulonate synthase, partial [Sphingomicrobium sp.]